MSLIFLISFVVFGAHLLALSFSKSNYQKLQKDNGEKFANQVTEQPSSQDEGFKRGRFEIDYRQ